MFTIYRDVPVKTLQKIKCYSLKKKKHYYRFEPMYGDIPVVNLVKDGKAQVVINNRGLAYASRNRLKFKKTKKQIVDVIIRKERW